ncbi:MAG: outer membrane lipoprotein-sorting protein [Proteobacteria bacterium]|nr:outer membrane lipoprotein-sorting protein [Pseudomonadota bacterium]
MLRNISLISTVAMGVSLLVAMPAAHAQSVQEILKKVDKVGHAESSRVKMTQTVKTPSGDSRTFKMLAYSQNGNEKGLTVYVAPNQVRGMKILTLNDGDDIWTYFPRTNRTRKIASSARNRKVQGSDFTYDDMAAGKMAKQWKGKVLGSEKIDGKDCYKLELRPTPSGPKSYSKTIAWIAKADYTSLRVEYFDLDGDKIKRLSIGNYKKISGVMIPFEYAMTNLTDGGKTVMKVAAAEVNTKLDPALFTEAGLSK